jgi:hypothetical protein
VNRRIRDDNEFGERDKCGPASAEAILANVAPAKQCTQAQAIQTSYTGAHWMEEPAKRFEIAAVHQALKAVGPGRKEDRSTQAVG